MNNHSAAAARHAIAETASGRVRGVDSDGVFAFKGIPYGASTAGHNRFMPPRKPKPWTGVRDALSYGPMAIQAIGQWPEPWNTLMKGNMTWDHERSEDCLVLNVWTPALDDGGKRPVMVWCHGGGFNNGTGDADWHDGARLARHHDVVVVHFNHRLNVFGFLYLGELGGERYADSGNVGMLDIVAVLQWVRDNIERFGGDPGNVTVLGESGGGAKVTTLMAMPAAQGLFHKAIVQSGSMLRASSSEEATRFARALLDRLGVRPGQLDQLHEIAPEKLLEAKQALESAEENLWKRVAYKPVVDGRSLPRHPFDPDAPRISADVPMLIGVTRDESTYLPMFDPALRSLDTAGVFAELQTLGICGAQAEQLVASYHARRPGESLVDVYIAIMSDLKFRVGAIRQAERKCAQGSAPAYMYLFAWEAPGGEYKAGHNLEVPFVFDNVDMAPGLHGPNPDLSLYELARNMSRAWVAFARTGSPNHAGLPNWRPYDLKNRATMVLDHTCAAVNDPQREDRLAMESCAGQLIGL
jgi:para-nitrobenzyl esterase